MNQIESNATTLLKQPSTYFNLYFEELRYYLNPLFQYKQGNCHNVAHYASLILKSYHVSQKKIWIYAPCRYIENAKTAIKLPDPNNISSDGTLIWGFHVANLIKFEGQELVYDFFIDEEKPMTVGQWIEKMQVKNFYIDIEIPEKYLFLTKDSEVKKNGVFNGQYFEYEGLCREDNWVAKGLAINETAIYFYKNEFYHFQYQTPLSNDYKLLVGRINNFECVIRDRSFNKKMTLEFQQKHEKVIEKYRSIYEQNLEKWIEKVNAFL